VLRWKRQSSWIRAGGIQIGLDEALVHVLGVKKTRVLLASHADLTIIEQTAGHRAQDGLHRFAVCAMSGASTATAVLDARRTLFAARQGVLAIRVIEAGCTGRPPAQSDVRQRPQLSDRRHRMWPKGRRWCEVWEAAPIERLYLLGVRS